MSPVNQRAKRAKRASHATPETAARRDGFALPLAIMVLALLTMGLVAGFAVSTSEQSVSASQKAQARAYTYAQMGLEAFLTKRKETGFCPQCWLVNATAASGTVKATLNILPTQMESVTVKYGSGTAFVRVTPVWLDPANGKGTYFLSSTGADSTSMVATGLGTTRAATRTVGVFVTWNKTTLNVLGALVSFSGIVKNGTGAISGIDACGGGVNVPGITVPMLGGVTVNGGFTPAGNPPYDTLKTFSQDSAAAKLDWAGITSGSALTADITIGSSTFPSAGTFAADTNYWPIIHITNNGAGAYTLPWAGRGMLIVDGDLIINGSNQWDGVVLVGGQLTSNGNNVTSGTVMSGLNLLTGGSAGAVNDATLNGQKSYLYNSCSVAKATSSMARYTMVPNTWMDNVAGY